MKPPSRRQPGHHCGRLLQIGNQRAVVESRNEAVSPVQRRRSGSLRSSPSLAPRNGAMQVVEAGPLSRARTSVFLFRDATQSCIWPAEISGSVAAHPVALDCSRPDRACDYPVRSECGGALNVWRRADASQVAWRLATSRPRQGREIEPAAAVDGDVVRTLQWTGS